MKIQLGVEFDSLTYLGLHKYELGFVLFLQVWLNPVLKCKYS